MRKKAKWVALKSRSTYYDKCYRLQRGKDGLTVAFIWMKEDADKIVKLLNKAEEVK